MPPPSSAPPTSTTPSRIIHRAARIEDWVHDIRDRCARRRGHIPVVVPYAGYGSTQWVRILCRVLLAKPKSAESMAARRLATAANQYPGIRGWRSFTSVPVNDVTVTIEIGGQVHHVQADRGGVVDTVVPISLEPGTHVAHLHTSESARVDAPFYVVPPDAQRGIISDVDDTVMVTALPRPLLAAWNTFVLDEHARIPTPGMAVLLDRLVRNDPGSPVIYLSTGAWNVAPTLTRFLSRNLYPSGTLLLTDWGPTHDRLFRSGQDHKRTNLRRLAQEFPGIRWILIGDDGQHDEAIYSDFQKEYPGSVAAVAIRQLSTSEAVLAGGRSKDEASGTPDAPWVYGPDGSSISDQLVELGLLPAVTSQP